MVAINEFITDTEAEIAALKELCAEIDVPVELAVYGRMVRTVELTLLEPFAKTIETSPANHTRLYDNNLSVEEKLKRLYRNLLSRYQGEF